VPDLRGFGESDRHETGLDAYAAPGQAASVVGLIEDLGSGTSRSTAWRCRPS
jgi:hypothetical protein